MTKKIRPYNTIISAIGDTFIKGENPTQQEIDLSKVSDEKLIELGRMYPEAIYEQVWRAASDVFDN